MPSTKLNLKGEPARVVVPAATPFQKAQAKAEGLWGDERQSDWQKLRFLSFQCCLLIWGCEIQ